MFVVSNNQQCFTLRASNEIDRQQWITAIDLAKTQMKQAKKQTQNLDKLRTVNNSHTEINSIERVKHENRTQSLDSPKKSPTPQQSRLETASNTSLSSEETEQINSLNTEILEKSLEKDLASMRKLISEKHCDIEKFYKIAEDYYKTAKSFHKLSKQEMTNEVKNRQQITHQMEILAQDHLKLQKSVQIAKKVLVIKYYKSVSSIKV